MAQFDLVKQQRIAKEAFEGEKSKVFQRQDFCVPQLLLFNVSVHPRNTVFYNRDLFTRVKDFCLKGLWSPAPVSLTICLP